MTLDEALAVMNRRKHNEEDGWDKKYVDETPIERQLVTDQEGYYCSPHYTPWECEAIAEKYLREEEENGNG